jgi:hypothetical protein
LTNRGCGVGPTPGSEAINIEEARTGLNSVASTKSRSKSFLFSSQPPIMVLKPEVINAFRVLEIDPTSTDLKQATTAYKKLALKHHPDRNFGDQSAKERFQKVNIILLIPVVLRC